MVAWIKNAFSKESSIKGATFLLMMTLVISNLMGVIRDHFLAGRISTYYLDIYYAGFKVPDLVFNLLILGAVSSVFIPIFTEKISQKNQKRAFEIANRLLTAGLVFTILSAIVFYFLIPLIIPILVPKFSLDRIEMTIKLSRILMLTPIFFSLSYTTSGILNSYHRFFAYSLAPLFYNLAIILGVIFLSDRFGIFGVAWAVVFGAMLHFLIQIPTLTKIGFRFRLSAFHRDPELKRILYLMIPRSVGLGTNQLTLFAFTAISSALAAGSIAVFTFADNIQTMPVVVFGTSLATVLFPTLSIKAADNNKEDFLKYFYRAVKAILYMMTPLAVFFLIFSQSVVKIILDNGQFSAFDSVRASETLAVFCLAIVFESILTIIVRAFFAQKNTKIPMYASVFSMIIAIFSGYLFSRHLGVPGLALGIAMSNFFSVVFLFYFFHKKFIRIDFSNLFSFFGRIIIASIFSGYIIFFIRKIFSSFSPVTGLLFSIIEITIAFVIFGLTYIGVSRILKVDEFSLVLKNLLKKFSRQNKFDQGENGSNLERP